MVIGQIRAENRLAALLRATSTGVWTTSAEGQFQERQPSWEHFTGQDWPQYERFGGFEVVHPDDRDSVRSLWRQAIDAAAPFASEYRLWHAASREYRFVSVCGAPVFDAEGAIFEWIGVLTDIDDRKRAEMRVRDAGERLAAALNASETGTFRWDITTNALDWDENLNRLFGLPAGDTAKSLDRFLGLVHSDDRARVIEAVQRCSQNGENFSEDFRVILPDGSIRWLSDKGRTYYDAAGRPAYMTGACVDITERKRTEEALRASEARFQRAMIAAAGIIYEWDVTTGIVYRSPGLLALVGIRPEEAETTSEWWFQRVHPDDLATMSEAVLRGGEALDREYRVRHADGHWVWVWDRATLFVDEDGRPLKLAGSTLDVTQRKNSEAELRRNQLRYSTMAETVPEILFTSDPHGACDYVSSRFYEYTGMGQGTGLGSGWTAAIHAEDKEQAALRWQDAVRTGSEYQDEYRLRRWDGEYRWFRARAVPLRRRDGRIAEWAGVSADVHDLKHAQELLEQRTRELEMSNTELQRFAYIVSHDLQTPLRTVASMTKLLLRRVGTSADDDSRQLMGYIEGGIRRMSKLIADLLDYARLIQSGKSTIKTDATESARWAVANLQTQADETQATIVLDNLPEVQADERLARVLQNLIGNAIKYRGADPPSIRISAEPDGDDWLFSIRDNGIGFDMRYAEQIFEVFQRLHGPDKYEGTGIGLAICRKIIEEYGGRIWAESEPGCGSTFYFTVPGLRSGRDLAVPA